MQRWVDRLPVASVGNSLLLAVITREGQQSADKIEMQQEPSVGMVRWQQSLCLSGKKQGGGAERPYARQVSREWSSSSGTSGACACTRVDARWATDTGIQHYQESVPVRRRYHWAGDKAAPSAVAVAHTTPPHAINPGTGAQRGSTLWRPADVAGSTRVGSQRNACGTVSTAAQC